MATGTTSSIGQLMLIVAFAVGIWELIQAWNQTCLGIFEDKHSCEVARNIERRRGDCAEASKRSCGSLKGDAYAECHERVFCGCLAKFGLGCY
jgi:hypothetical protein